MLQQNKSINKGGARCPVSWTLLCSVCFSLHSFQVQSCCAVKQAHSKVRGCDWKLLGHNWTWKFILKCHVLLWLWLNDQYKHLSCLYWKTEHPPPQKKAQRKQLSFWLSFLSQCPQDLWWTSDHRISQHCTFLLGLWVLYCSPQGVKPCHSKVQRRGRLKWTAGFLEC